MLGSLIDMQGNQYPRERADVALPCTQRTSSLQTVTRATILWKVEFDTS